MKDSTQRNEPAGPVPLGQRLYDNVFLLLIVGLAIMLTLYTAWGMWEITSLPVGKLP